MTCVSASCYLTAALIICSCHHSCSFKCFRLTGHTNMLCIYTMWRPTAARLSRPVSPLSLWIGEHVHVTETWIHGCKVSCWQQRCQHLSASCVAELQAGEKCKHVLGLPEPWPDKEMYVEWTDYNIIASMRGIYIYIQYIDASHACNYICVDRIFSLDL